jgi:hypothetical protein
MRNRVHCLRVRDSIDISPRVVLDARQGLEAEVAWRESVIFFGAALSVSRSPSVL